MLCLFKIGICELLWWENELCDIFTKKKTMNVVMRAILSELKIECIEYACVFSIWRRDFWYSIKACWGIFQSIEANAMHLFLRKCAYKVQPTEKNCFEDLLIVCLTQFVFVPDFANDKYEYFLGNIIVMHNFFLSFTLESFMNLVFWFKF